MLYKLVIFDMDGVLFDFENFWIKLHEALGTLVEGKKLTKQYLDSDFNMLVDAVVVNLWAGKDAKQYYDLVESIEYLPGVKETFDFVHKKGYSSAIVSGSSIDVAKRVQKDHGAMHLFANELVIKDGKITKESYWPVAEGTKEKAEIITKLCKDLDISRLECIYIGDSKKDIEAFKIVGKSIAFNSTCPELKAIATHVVDSKNLTDVIQYLE